MGLTLQDSAEISAMEVGILSMLYECLLWYAFVVRLTRDGVRGYSLVPQYIQSTLHAVRIGASSQSIEEQRKAVPCGA